MMMMMKSAAAPRSPSGAIAAVLLGLLAFQAGLRIIPEFGQNDKNTLLTGVRDILEDVQALDDELEDLKVLLLPSSSTGEEASVVSTCPINGGNRIGFAENFTGPQERRAQALEAYDTTAITHSHFSKEVFAENLRVLQHLRVEAHMAMLSRDMSRSNATTAWARSLEKQQKQFQTRMLARQTRLQTLAEARTEAQSDMSWRHDFPGFHQAHARHGKTMQDIEFRRQARLQARLEKRALAQATQDGFKQYFQAREEMRLEIRSNRSWAQDFPGALQARAQHMQTMEEIEARKQIRLQARMEKRGFAQRRGERHTDMMHPVHDLEGQSLQKSLEASIEAMANMSWDQDFQGAEQARAEHANRMQEFEIRRQARAQARKDLRAMAERTQDGFIDYFKARKEAQAERRRERELHAFAQTTTDGFTEYFSARKAAQAKRRMGGQPIGWISQADLASKKQTHNQKPDDLAWAEVVSQLERLESPLGGRSSSQVQDMEPAELTDFVQGLVDLLAY